MHIRVKSRSRLAISLSLLVAVILCTAWYSVSSARSHELEVEGQWSMTGAATQITVSPGDSLWTIAIRYGPQAVDPRLLVYELRQYNELESAMLRVGQSLELPVAWALLSKATSGHGVIR